MCFVGIQGIMMHCANMKDVLNEYGLKQHVTRISKYYKPLNKIDVASFKQDLCN